MEEGVIVTIVRYIMCPICHEEYPEPFMPNDTPDRIIGVMIDASWHTITVKGITEFVCPECFKKHRNSYGWLIHDVEEVIK
jgi:hypothetical protein